MTKAHLISNDKNNVDLLLEPIKGGDTISTATINELINASEFNNLRINTASITNAIAELNDVLKPLQESQSGREIRYQVLERIDASIIINIESDEMSASAEITTAQGGTHLTAKAILTAAQEAGVKKGFSKENLVKLAQLAAKEPSNTQVSAQIALGKLPINGNDAQIKPLVESAQARILRPKKREDGSVDMRDLGDIICVKVGDPLIKKIPLSEGREGYTVTATTLDPSPGNDVELIPGEGTVISPKNENVLLSNKVGLPKMIPNGMEVDEVYKIKNVSVATGNINFTGSVIIEGDVTEGMKVIASGDITVGGFVESAMIESGGDITISGGIIGRKHDIEQTKVTDVTMSVSVNAKGNIYAKYCQYAQITCTQDVRIENQLLHSLLDVNGKLWIGKAEKADGKLIGGYTKIGKSVQAGMIGAPAGSNTHINFERKINKLKDEINDIDDLMHIESDKTTELLNAVNKLKALPKDKAKPDLLAKVVASYQVHAKRMGEILEQKAAVEQKLQDYKDSVYIEATEKLYHGVEMIVGDFNDRSRREYGPSRMICKERKIVIDPIVNSPGN
ncbi:FapA family protein [Colwellia asteriadis]|uniref:FapA family protein n=1 Tax=Colwellia asteriadis TaxID=517723 RepID=A0ABN1L6H6_9GAMM